MGVVESEVKTKRSKFEIIVDCIRVALGDDIEVRKTSNINGGSYRLYLSTVDYIVLFLDKNKTSIVVKYRGVYKYDLGMDAIDLYYDILFRLQMIIHRDTIIAEGSRLGSIKYNAWSGITYKGRVVQIKGFTIFIRGSIIYVPRLKDSREYKYIIEKRVFNIQTFLINNTRSNRLSERTIDTDGLYKISNDILKDFVENILYPLKCEAK